ncbi:Coronin-7 [Chytriomyces hyalinus]|nr:Coronin-7 [Chytriomyces hyalinus]
MSLPRSSSSLSNYSSGSATIGRTASKRFSVPVSPFRNVQLNETSKWTHVRGVSGTSDSVSTDRLGRVAVKTATGEVTVASGDECLTAKSVSPVHSFDLAYDGTLLATGSSDAARVFRVSGDEAILSDTVSGAAVAAAGSLTWHPTAAGILVAAAENRVAFVETAKNRDAVSLSLESAFVSLDFNADGSLLACSGKDSVVRVFDPRASVDPIATTPMHHPGGKPPRVIWLSGGSLDFNFLTAGFSKTRDREFALWDLRNLEYGPVMNQRIDSSSGSLIPMYDADSNIIFLTGKGDTTIRTYEVSSASGLTPLPASFVASKPITSAALLPKLCMDVMECEVARIMAVCGESVVPMSATVLRKSKGDFQADLFPDTLDRSPAISAEAWINGQTPRMTRINLDPRANRSTTMKSPAPRLPPPAVGKVPPRIPAKSLSLKSPLGSSPIAANMEPESPTTPRALAYSPIQLNSMPQLQYMPPVAAVSPELIEETLTRLFKTFQQEQSPEQHFSPVLSKLDQILSSLDTLNGRVSTLETRITKLESVEASNGTAEIASLLDKYAAKQEETMKTVASLTSNQEATLAATALESLAVRLEGIAGTVSELKENDSHWRDTVSAVSARLEAVAGAAAAERQHNQNTSSAALQSLTTDISGGIQALPARVSEKVNQTVEAGLDARVLSLRAHVEDQIVKVSVPLAALSTRLDEVEKAVGSLREGTTEAFDVAFAKQTTSLLSMMDEVVREQQEMHTEKTKRSSYRVSMPGVPNMGIASGISKLVGTGRLAMNRVGSSESFGEGPSGDGHASPDEYGEEQVQDEVEVGH